MPQKGKAGPVMTELSGEVRAMANGFAAIETERGFVVLELMGAEPDVGDRVAGLRFSHGHQRVRLVRQSRELSVSVQAIDATWGHWYLPCKRLQADEVWSFIHSKEKRVRPEDRGTGRGDCWTWTAICADTKLIPCWHVGGRDAEAARLFMEDLASRLASRVQLTTDGHRAYLPGRGIVHPS